jgi:RNAse (barnase) inhibitor barstar
MPIVSDPQHSKGPQDAWKAGWICPRCHEEVPEWFLTCWNCAGMKPLQLASSTDRIVEIDGLQFSDLAEFSAHFEERTGLAPCGRNLDAFNDILRAESGFGAPPGGFTIRWRNHKVSMERLGTLFDEIVEIIRGHGPGGSEANDNVRLELL